MPICLLPKVSKRRRASPFISSNTRCKNMSGCARRLKNYSAKRLRKACGRAPMSEVHAVILAGGSGSRLWPLSRQQLPKQFLALDGDASLLQTTIERLSPVIDADSVLIVTQESHAKGEAYHALLPYRTLFEPVGRNTAPAIALAAAYLMAERGDPVMVVLPADHIIKDEVQFRAHLNIAIQAAASGKLI